MKLIKAIIIGVFGLFLFGLGWATTDFNYKKTNRETQRKKDVQQIVDYFSSYQKNLVYYLPTGIKAGKYQIGTSATGCLLKNKFCEIDNDHCLNLNYLTRNSDIDVPSDILIGRRNKTGYMATISNDGQIEITACGAETEIITAAMPDLPKVNIDQVTTSSAIIDENI